MDDRRVRRPVVQLKFATSGDPSPYRSWYGDGLFYVVDKIERRPYVRRMDPEKREAYEALLKANEEALSSLEHDIARQQSTITTIKMRIARLNTLLDVDD